MSTRFFAAKAAAVALAVATLMVTSSAGATIAIQLSRAQQACRSDMVVRASVLDQRSMWNEDRSQIITLTRLRVTQYIRGAGASELTLRQFGGQVGDLVSQIAGDGVLVQGQDVVLFLRSGAGVVYLTAMAQSVYHLIHTPSAEIVARRSLQDLSFAVPQNGQMSIVAPPAEPDESLEHLIASLRGIAGCAP